MPQSENPATLGNSTAPSAPAAPRIVLFGIRCRFTDVVLRTLVAAGLPPDAVLIPGPPGTESPVRVVKMRSMLPIAGAGQALLDVDDVPIYRVGRLSLPSSLDLVRSFMPDAIAVACYPTRIPRTVRSLARLGAVNVHPSLLPQGRGPDPLFWALRHGHGQGAVTIHELVDQLDAGPILAQRSFTVRDGTTESALESAAARLGGELLAQTMTDLQAGTAQRRAQDERYATYDGWPDSNDYTIDTARDARAAFNFIRGVRERADPISIDTGDRLLPVADAISYDASPDDGAPSRPDEAWVRFESGYLLVRLATP